MTRYRMYSHSNTNAEGRNGTKYNYYTQVMHIYYVHISKKSMKNITVEVNWVMSITKSTLL